MYRYTVFAGLLMMLAAVSCGGGEVTVLGEGSYHVGAGYNRVFRLPDGTRVTLSPQTTISLEKGFGKDNREIHLSGEALFDVPKAPNWPMTINTRDLRIAVMGAEDPPTGGLRARFRVDAPGGRPGEEVDLLEGRIKASKAFHSDTDNVPEVMDAGEMVMVNRDVDLIEKEKLNPEEIARLRARW
jgi:ferric-dicitrate binding protein FerR (iron transport regulator)